MLATEASGERRHLYNIECSGQLQKFETCLTGSSAGGASPHAITPPRERLVGDMHCCNRLEMFVID